MSTSLTTNANAEPSLHANLTNKGKYTTYSKLVRPDHIEKHLSEDGTYGEFAIYPIQKGFGITLGNVLRRVMLSSVRGSVISAVKIADVDHEFSVITGVSQDVVSICLNLRSVIIKTDLESAEATLEAQGPCVVTADMINMPKGVLVMNKDHVLFEIDSAVKVSMSLQIKSGIGSIVNEIDSATDHCLGEIKLDCNFSPIRNVCFVVDDTARVDQFIDYDRLNVNVKTNGTISPDDALGIAAAIVRDYMQVFINFDERGFAVTKEAEAEEDANCYNLHLFRKTSDLRELSVRSANCLSNAGIHLIGDLVCKTEAEMMRMPNFGKKSLRELCDFLESVGLSFGLDIGPWPPENMEHLCELARKKFD